MNDPALLLNQITLGRQPLQIIRQFKQSCLRYHRLPMGTFSQITASNVRVLGGAASAHYDYRKPKIDPWVLVNAGWYFQAS